MRGDLDTKSEVFPKQLDIKEMNNFRDIPPPKKKKKEKLTDNRTTNLDSSKLKEFANDNFTFDENSRQFSRTGKKHCGKRRNCSFRAISPFHTVFSKDLYCKHVNSRARLRKG